MIEILSQEGGSPVDAWTSERRAALVYIEMEGRMGTGFIVRSETTGSYYVLTAAHNLFGVADPTAPDPNQIRGGPNQPTVHANNCEPVDENAIKLRLGNIRGTSLYAQCKLYLGGPDIGAILLKPPGQTLPVLRLGRFQRNVHIVLAALGFRFGLSLQETPKKAEIDAVDGPRGSIIYTGTNAGGLSGAPYLSARGDVVGIHSGSLSEERPRFGFIAMVPLSNVTAALSDMGLPLDGTDRAALATQAIWGLVVVREMEGKQRAARDGEAVIRVYFNTESSSDDGTVEQPIRPDGVFIVLCPEGYPAQRETELRPAAVDGLGYVPRVIKLHCGGPPSNLKPNEIPTERQVSLTVRDRYVKTEMDDANTKWNALVPKLPYCMRTFVSPLKALYCARTNTARLEPLISKREIIDNHYREAASNASGDLQRHARVQYARFKIQTGSPCEGASEMQLAMSGATAIPGVGPVSSVVNEWADARIACTKKEAFLDQFAREQPNNNLSPEEISKNRDDAVATSFDALSAVAGQLDPSVRTASRGRFVRFLLEVSSTLSPRSDANEMGKKIQDSADLMNSWMAVFPQVVEGCQALSPALRSSSIADQLTELRKSCSS